MIINLNSNIYKKKCIKNAIKDFEHLADFTIKDNEDGLSINIKNIDKKFINNFQNEFCNYILYLMNI